MKIFDFVLFPESHRISWKIVVFLARLADVVGMKLNYIIIALSTAILLACSGPQVTTEGPEAVCGQSRGAQGELLADADAVWNRGDGWKALQEVKEKIDETEEAGKPDPSLYFRRSDWGMRMGAKATARRDITSLFQPSSSA